MESEPLRKGSVCGEHQEHEHTSPESIDLSLLIGTKLLAREDEPKLEPRRYTLKTYSISPSIQLTAKFARPRNVRTVQSRGSFRCMVRHGQLSKRDRSLRPRKL